MSIKAETRRRQVREVLGFKTEAMARVWMGVLKPFEDSKRIVVSRARTVGQKR